MSGRVQLRASTYGKCKQGYYLPSKPNKYIGTWPITGRSSWEFAFMKWLDSNDSVITWTSESIIIPYYNPVKNRPAKYYTDFSFVTETGDKFLIEVKPSSQTKAPQLNRFKKQKSAQAALNAWLVNDSKWQAAREWCKLNDYKFQIITEKELFRK